MPVKYLKLPVLMPQEIERFWLKVERGPVDECWPWTAASDWDGYGCFKITRGRDARLDLRAHRIAYMLHYGEDPWPFVVRHKVCDNPPCCNPHHLAKGTIADNNRDARDKGRTAKGDNHGSRKHPDRMTRGEKLHLSKLTEREVVAIRTIYAIGEHTHIQIAAIFRLHRSTVIRIVQRQTWTHI